MYTYGQIVTALGGPYATKARPVLILQNPKFKTGDSVIIAPLTSVQNCEINTRIVVRPSKNNGLDRDCFVEVDKITAIMVTAIGPVVGMLEESTLSEVTAMAVSLVSP